MAFPEGDYTPYGYLRNPYHRASAGWSSLEGGNLRTSDHHLGMEWAYAWHRGTTLRAGISLATGSGESRCLTRADYSAIGYASRYHSANVLGFDWTLDGVVVAARYFLVDESLCAHLEATNTSPLPRRFRLEVIGRVWVHEGVATVQTNGSTAIFRATDDSGGPPVHALAVSGSGLTPVRQLDDEAVPEAEVWVGSGMDVELAPGTRAQLTAALGRAESEDRALEAARSALPLAATRLRELLAEDDAFYQRCPVLAGDWPHGWREGLVYDFETTRMCAMPAGGIFGDVWPSWMSGWPRIVVAEGTLDMMRLAYADPGLAQRAVLTMFRDSPGDNVPCVFQDGSFNMVAADGSQCGTSPAWCLPFLNLELLYLRTLDRTWLAELFPYLERYLDWWLRNRTDSRGWIVYKCTWEAGEDGNLRLDPSGSGDADISRRVRPVELQATMALSASTMALFAGELGLVDQKQRWGRVAAAYRRRTRRMFDPVPGRFRDWLIQEHRFQGEGTGEQYWGADSLRFSPLSLTPLLGGVATQEQAQALRREVELHCTAPWTSWPSWCHVLAECGSAAGLHGLIGEMAWGVIDLMYRRNNRRSLAEAPRPTPGASPEYWPQDLRDWNASDAYGWGATTANLLLRHLFGLQESRSTRTWVLDLVPALPQALLQNGRIYTVRNFQYRGLLLNLSYAWNGDSIEAELELHEARRCVVRAAGGSTVHRSRLPSSLHAFKLVNGHRHRLLLRP